MLTLKAFQRFGRAFPARRSNGSPHILVVGGQQDAAVAHAMTCLAPEAVVTVLPAIMATRGRRANERLLTEISSHDVVFLSSRLSLLHEVETLMDLRGSERIKLVPEISFSAFHPDQVRVGPNERDPVRGPAGSAHSALILFGFRSGFLPMQVARLFQRCVFERVGYFDAWDASVDHLHRLCAETTLNVDAALARWTRRGCFMHSSNHIKPYVAVDLARELLGQSGIAYHECNLEDFIPADPGTGESWPIYPQIAGHYGVPGSALFPRPATGRDASRSAMSLSSFIAASFATYERFSPRALVCQRIEQWQADTGLSADLRRFAMDA